MKRLLHIAALLLATTLPIGQSVAFELNLNKLGAALGNIKDATGEVDEEQELKIGGRLSAKLLGAAALVENRKIQLYVNRVGRWLASQTERADLEWHFGVLDVDSINAFAAPGGYVFITRGLLLTMDSEAELAGVLAHEITHVLRRHHLEAIKTRAQRELTLNIMSALSDDDDGGMMDTMIDMGMDLYSKGLDRDDEYEADRMGVVIAARAGYEPFGLPVSLLALAEVNSEDDSISLMSNTHPPVSERLARLDELMEGNFEAFRDQPLASERFRAIRQLLEKTEH